MDRLAVAQHLYSHSYHALGDPKILLSVAQNLLAAIEDRLTERLVQAREDKEIPPFGDTLNQKLTAYRMHLAHKRKVTPIDFMFIGELQELVASHDRTAMEFRRKDAFVIADEDYSLRTLTPEKTKTYIERTKSLLSRA